MDRTIVDLAAEATAGADSGEMLPGKKKPAKPEAQHRVPVTQCVDAIGMPFMRQRSLSFIAGQQQFGLVFCTDLLRVLR